MNSPPCQETDMKVVLPHLKVFWLSKDNLTEHNKGKRRRGSKKKREKDHIKEWTRRMDFVSSTRAAENRTRWKGIVAKSSQICNGQQPSKVMGIKRKKGKVKSKLDNTHEQQ